MNFYLSVVIDSGNYMTIILHSCHDYMVCVDGRKYREHTHRKAPYISDSGSNKFNSPLPTTSIHKCFSAFVLPIFIAILAETKKMTKMQGRHYKALIVERMAW